MVEKVIENRLERMYNCVVTMGKHMKSMRKDVSAMCNLSEGIEEKGRIEGQAEGEARLILKMYKNGLSPEQIATATDKTIEEIDAIIVAAKMKKDGEGQ